MSTDASAPLDALGICIGAFPSDPSGGTDGWRQIGSLWFRDGTMRVASVRLGEHCVLAVSQSGASFEADHLLGIYIRDGATMPRDRCAHAGGPDFRSALIWDGRTETLFLIDSGRDDGWAYSIRGRTILVSDTVRGVRGNLPGRPTWNAVYLSDWMFGLGSQPVTATAFADISRTQPRTTSLWHAGTFTPGQQIPPSPCSHSTAIRDPVDSLLHTLAGALNHSIRQAERPALLLSGGLDSSLLAATWPADRTATFATFRPEGVPRPRSAESRIVQLSGGPGDSREIVVREADLAGWLNTELDRLLSRLDDPPIAAPGMIPVRGYTYSKLRSLEVDLAVDGEGADEIFDLPWSPTDYWLAGSRRHAVWLALADPRFRSRRALLRVVGQMTGQRAFGAPFDGRVPRHAWCTEAVREDPAVHSAFARHIDRLTATHPTDRLIGVLDSVATRSSKAVNRALAASSGVRTSSPYFNECLSAQAISLPAELKLVPRHRKPAMRAMLERLQVPTNSDFGVSQNEYRLQLAVLRSLIRSELADLGPLRTWVLPEHLNGGNSQDWRAFDTHIRLQLGLRWMQVVGGNTP